ncbi:hypothetical protein SmJEL517_g04089 [Synchytrium microbalum]|uniref:Uncharacterized protein n=1 Tax=Synchytrium microbalum TaxID=1806994 RepID=A0A507C0F5_9FUNG|nr:uncharacterized protein SmJEL517_g04089 [Synchytrium microbalum]TPX32891.1 hypothetical protein SmJEL517_g04089 [Synchytrium microbalum]
MGEANDPKQKAFSMVRPYCVQMMQEQASCTLPRVMPCLTRLADILLEVSREFTDIKQVMSVLIEYIFFPLSLIIKHPQVSNNNLEASLRIAAIVLELSPSIPKPIWSDFMVIIPTLLSAKSKKLNEETKLWCVKCLKALVSKPPIEWKMFPIPIIAEIITQLLDLAATEKLLELQVDSLSSLRIIVKSIPDAPILIQFTPGVISGLVKVALRDKKDHHTIIEGAILGIDELLCRVFDDSLYPHNERIANVNQAIQDLVKNKEATTPKLPPVIAKSLQPLGQAINTLTAALQTHPSPYVRLALLTMAANVSQKCHHTLSTSLPRLYETLISYWDDPNILVSAACQERIKDIVPTPILKSSFQLFLQGLPRKLERGSEEEKLGALSIASGYLVVLKDHAPVAVSIALAKLTPGLIHALTLETSDVGLVEARIAGGLLDTLSSGPSDVVNITTFPRRRFVYFRDQRVEAAVNTFLRKLVVYGDVYLLFDHLTSLFRGTALSGEVQAESLYVLNEFCLGLVSSDGRDSKHNNVNDVIKSLVQDLVSSGILELGGRYTADNASSSTSSLEPKSSAAATASQSEQTVADQNANILKKSLVLETISSASRVLGTDFKPLLLSALYPILTCLSSTSHPISSSASASLSIISKSCNYTSTSQMMIDNVDYIADSVRKRLKYVSLNPHAPQVLNAAVMVGGIKIIDYLDDSVEEVLEALDLSGVAQSQQGQELVSVLLTILETLDAQSKSEAPSADKAMATEDVKPDEDLKDGFKGVSEEMRKFYLLNYSHAKPAEKSSEPSSKAKMEEIEEFFSARHAAKGEADEEQDSNSDVERDAAEDEVANNSQPNDPPLAPVSRAERLAHVCLLKTRHYLSSDSTFLCLVALQTARTALPLLRNPETRDTSIHAVWPSVLSRLSDSNTPVAMEAARVISIIATVSGDFVSRRVIEGVWPRVEHVLNALITEFSLHSQHHNSPSRAKSVMMPPDKYSSKSKLVRSILEIVTTIAHHVHTKVGDSRRVVNVIWPLLSSRVFGKDVSDAAIQALVALGSGRVKDTDGIWNVLSVARGVTRLSREGFRDVEWPAWYVDSVRQHGSVQDFEEPSLQVMNQLGLVV